MTLDRLIRRKDVAHLVGFSSRQVQAGARAVRWSELEVLRWVEQKKTERHGV
jgi:predicted DNA-binding transcriptional regulator AlpA